MEKVKTFNRYLLWNIKCVGSNTRSFIRSFVVPITLMMGNNGQLVVVNFLEEPTTAWADIRQNNVVRRSKQVKEHGRTIKSLNLMNITNLRVQHARVVIGPIGEQGQFVDFDAGHPADGKCELLLKYTEWDGGGGGMTVCRLHTLLTWRGSNPASKQSTSVPWPCHTRPSSCRTWTDGRAKVSWPFPWARTRPRSWNGCPPPWCRWRASGGGAWPTSGPGRHRSSVDTRRCATASGPGRCSPRLDYWCASTTTICCVRIYSAPRSMFAWSVEERTPWRWEVPRSRTWLRWLTYRESQNSIDREIRETFGTRRHLKTFGPRKRVVNRLTETRTGARFGEQVAASAVRVVLSPLMTSHLSLPPAHQTAKMMASPPRRPTYHRRRKQSKESILAQKNCLLLVRMRRSYMASSPALPPPIEYDRTSEVSNVVVSHSDVTPVSRLPVIILYPLFRCSLSTERRNVRAHEMNKICLVNILGKHLHTLENNRLRLTGTQATKFRET